MSRKQCYTLEELGKLYGVTLEVEAEFDCYEAEPRVMYDRNGDGYPGCEAHVSLCSVKVLRYESLNAKNEVDCTFWRCDRPDWFKLLDEIAYRIVSSDLDSFVEQFFVLDAEKSIEQVVDCKIALSRYLQASDRFDNIQREFAESCVELRKALKPGQRFLFESHVGVYYLVTTDDSGNFDVSKIERL